MALTYSLKYKKLNFYNRVILEKEGEIVIDRQSFRLKGKGAQDHGETIFFGDMKELSIKDDLLSFTMYTKEKYVLSNFSNLFDSFLKDFLRVRNEYLAETLFMKDGMLVHEYDGSIEILTAAGKIYSKGKSKIRFYEGSIVIVPETRECLAVNLAFLKSHEFDEDEYVLHLYLENGQTVNISKLGTSFPDVQETLEGLLGKMYEKVLHFMNEFMPEFSAETLLKLANRLKDGRFVPFSALKKIDETMPTRIDELLFRNNSIMAEKVRHMRKIAGDEHFYFSFCFGKSHETGDTFFRSWVLYALPEKNVVAVGRTSGEQDQTFHFFRIIMEQGSPSEKIKAKVAEIDQCLLTFRFDLTPIYKDRRELKKSKYRTAIKKLSYLRLLRKSYLGRSAAPDMESFRADLERMFARASEPVISRSAPRPAPRVSPTVAPTPGEVV